MTDTLSDDLTSRDRLTRVETKLDVLIQDLTPRHRDNDDRHRDADRRIREIEVTVSEIKTRVALMASVAGTVGGVITALIVRFLGA